MIVIKKVNNRWIPEQRSGIYTQLYSLLRSEHNDGFTREEIIEDIINGRLQIKWNEDSTPSERLEYIARHDVFGTRLDDDNIIKWLEYRNLLIEMQDKHVILQGFTDINRRLDKLLDFTLTLSNRINKLNDSLNRRSAVTIRELHETVFFNYNLRTLRNQVSKNKMWNEERGLEESYIDIEGYLIKLKKFPGTRAWITESVDLHPQIRGQLGLCQL